MTCIVGIETETGVIMGADSITAECVSWTAGSSFEPKVFRAGDYIIGFTNSFRMGEILRYHLTLPRPPKTRLHRHMVTAVIPAIRFALKAGGFATVSSGAEVGGDFLIATRGELYHVQSDYHVGRSPYGYDACGSGQQSALGALSATSDKEPTVRLRLALEAAEKHNLLVRRPWRFLAEKRRAHGQPQ